MVGLLLFEALVPASVGSSASPTVTVELNSLGVAAHRPLPAPTVSVPVPGLASTVEAGRPAVVAEDLLLNGSTTLNLSESTTIGNLTIEGSASLSFGNANWTATLTIDGSIFLDGNAHLTVWDAYLDLGSEYSGAQSLQTYGSATVDLQDVLVTSEGHNWEAQFYQGSNLTVDSTSLGSWCVASFYDNSSGFFDNSLVNADLIPSGSGRILLDDSGSPHLWLDFPNGSVGQVTLPPIEVETNWTFPGPGTVGVLSQIRLVDSWPGLFAVALYPGSAVTVSNSSEVDLSFLPTDTSLAISGLSFGIHANLTVATGQFRLELENVSVESWSFYPVASTLTLTDDQLGEVNGWDGSHISLTDSNLTDAGGYYATYDSSELTISGCTVTSQVAAYDASQVFLENSTVDDPGDQSVLAVGSASILATNVTMDLGSSYAVEDHGTVDLVAGVTVVTTFNGAPDAGVTVSALAPADDLLLAEASSGGNGVAHLNLPSGSFSAAGQISSVEYLITAIRAGAAAESPLQVSGSLQLDLSLTPLIVSTTPANGNGSLGPSSPISINFGLSMNQSATLAAIWIDPATPFDAGWDTQGTGLVLTPVATWPEGGAMTLTLSTSARTIDGVPLSSPLVLQFEVLTSGGPPMAPVPTVVATSPANGTVSNLNAGVNVAFSVPMDPTSTAAAFTISPSAPTGSLTVTGSSLLWTPAGFLAAGTGYEVTISSTARSTNLTPLASAYRFSFTTVGVSAVPDVVTWLPNNGSRSALAPAAIVVEWNVPMDPIPTGAAFSIFPSVAGTVQLLGENLTWTASGEFSPNTTYTVEIAVGALSLQGVPLPHPVWSAFTLAGPPSTPSLAPGLGTVDLLAIGGAVGAGITALAFLVIRRVRRTRDPPREPR
jgi:hypothetical protein